MNHGTRIASIETAPFEPQFLGAGYVMSFVHQQRLYHRLIRITLEDGTQGIGEVVRWPTYPPEEAAILEDAVFATLQGKDLSDLPQVVVACRQKDFRLIGAAQGLDTAFHDLVGRRANLPISALLGGAKASDVAEVYSLSCELPEVMVNDLRNASSEHKVIQAKLGGSSDLAMDEARLRAVLSEMTSDQTVLADFNGLLMPDQAAAFIAKFKDDRIVWEEPCGTYELNRDVARRIDGRVLFDQCLRTPEICVQAVRDGVAWGMVVKPGLLGGLAVTRFLRDLCTSAGIRMRIDGPWSGQISAAAALHLSVGCPPELLLGTIHLSIAVDTPGDMVRRTGVARLAPPPGAGLGLRPDNFFELEAVAGAPKVGHDLESAL